MSSLPEALNLTNSVELKRHARLSLHGENRYKLETLSMLEEYLERQCEMAFHDIEANLAVLSFYLKYPTMLKTAVVRKILIKALGSFPQNDVQLCLYQLPSKQLRSQPAISEIQELANLLDTCAFEAFWTAALQRCPDVLAMPGLLDNIRDFIATVIASSYAAISRLELSRHLGTAANSKEVDAIVNKYHWREKAGEIFVNNERKPGMDHLHKPKKLEHISTEMLHGILTAIQ